MIGAIVGLSIAVAVLAFLLALSIGVIERYREEWADNELADHAMCVAHIADVTSKRVVAMALREKARQWESVEEKANLNRLAREQFKTDGPSMPALWLNQQADLLDPDNRQEESE